MKKNCWVCESRPVARCGVHVLTVWTGMSSCIACYSMTLCRGTKSTRSTPSATCCASPPSASSSIAWMGTKRTILCCHFSSTQCHRANVALPHALPMFALHSLRLMFFLLSPLLAPPCVLRCTFCYRLQSTLLRLSEEGVSKPATDRITACLSQQRLGTRTWRPPTRVP